MNPQSLFYLQIAIILTMGLACGALARRWKLPSVVGELVGGVILGPTVFGTIAPGCHAWLFPALPAVTAGRDALIQLGLLLFMVVAGLEVDLSLLKGQGTRAIWISGCGIVVPFTLGYAIVLLMPHFWQQYTHIRLYLFATFLGTALSISALPVIARILIELELIKQRVGMLVIAAAMLDDLIGWSLFTVLLSLLPGQALYARSIWITLALVVGLFVAFLTIGRRLGQRMLNYAQRGSSITISTLIAIIIGFALLAGAMTESLGIHAVFGAFLVGIALAQHSNERMVAQAAIQQFVSGFFGPIYFASIGLHTNFAKDFDVPLVLLVLVVACVCKIGGVWLGARLGKVQSLEALAIAFGMNARGAMGMVLASLALDHGLINRQLFVSLIIMSIATSLLSGPAMRHCLQSHAARKARS